MKRRTKEDFRCVDCTAYFTDRKLAEEHYLKCGHNLKIWRRGRQIGTLKVKSPPETEKGWKRPWNTPYSSLTPREKAEDEKALKQFTAGGVFT